MSDIIQLLPDAVANQIAAGEVIQRPASAIKEMLENAIDAKADRIRVNIQNAGKTRIQVVDNGCGMSATDARLSIERHATSKIRKAEDLFKIRTMGFRGEAMASIAAIAQVDLKSRREEDEVGTFIQIEGSKIMDQQPEAMPAGTNLTVKNLFYNIPARRNFLKSNAVEMRHIIDEFQRVALANPDIFFSMDSDGKDVYYLEKGNLKQRIVHLFGKNYDQRLVPVEEETSIISITGFIGKPEFAKKTRGEQFFFVNNRFVRDPYLHHAVMNAYEDILPSDSFPLYILFIEIDPAKIDINVHPTKTEIKYDDSRSVYAIIRSAVKRSLGRYNVMPTLDFNQETSFSNFIDSKASPIEDLRPPAISVNPSFNPFEKQETDKQGAGQRADRATGSNFPSEKRTIPRNWETLYQITEEEDNSPAQLNILDEKEPSQKEDHSKKIFFQLHNKYILSQIHSGIMVVHQQRAHERVLFEHFKKQLELHQGSSQQSLFPQTIELNPSDKALLESILPEIRSLGFQIRHFGANTYIIDGLPAELDANLNEAEIIEKILEDIKNDSSKISSHKHESLAKSLAKSAAIKSGTALDTQSMAELIDRLFACESPNLSIHGKPSIITYNLEDLAERFE